ncbi:putative basic membrane lipoprotein [Crocosphaera subtropica ATCC 51142]|uniref:Basic membrane lipoprotein n=1 Tax=Crocosphaera subtropica (strain ATCC 51142 / BH68) TaxID=43989 RepID=B1WP50_CROS5|nr:BMP family protein [Crocosphaera subtropica]ACB53229.1 putative basic membrane lipoprotein [Crocosphaera subtropica ATCC 51142]
MKSPLKRRKFIGFTSALLGSLVLKACGNNDNSTSTNSENPTFQTEEQKTTETQNPLKIAIVLPGIITDKAWNQTGYEGVKLTQEKLGAEIAYIEQVSQADQAETLADFARRGYNLVYAHGGQFDAAIQQVARQFPDTFFIGVNGAVEGENIASLRIDHLQGSYLCGMLGAMMTKSNQMAYITAQSFQATNEELRGFELGAKSINPDIKITSSYTGDWNDAAKAKEATLALISSGADVVYQWLDNASPAVLQTAQEKGVYAFGNTVDQLNIAPEAVLTTPVKRLDLAINYIAELVTKNELEGKIYSLGLDYPDILYLGEFNEVVTDDMIAKINDVKQEIITKKITFEPCQKDGKSTLCVNKTVS